MTPCPLRHSAQQAPSSIAFDSVQECLTFAELDRLAEKLVKNLAAHGIQSGDRIAVQHAPCAHLVALFFAAWRMGVSLCPLHKHIPPSQIETFLNRIDAKLFIASFPFQSPLRPTRIPPSPPALFLFTSGTSAAPKIAILSLSQLLSNAEPLIQTLHLQSGDRWLLNLPLYHVGGIGILLRCVLAKATLSLQDKDPLITHISAVPTHLYRATPIYRNLRYLLIGGAPIPSYPERLPCVLTYGLTEMGSAVTTRFRSPRVQNHFSLGFPLPGREIKLLPTQEILVRGPCLFIGYWEQEFIEELLLEKKEILRSGNRRQAPSRQWINSSLDLGLKGWDRADLPVQRPFDAEGWFATGDLGMLSQDGLIIFGRKDRQFISGGENIQPEEIEQQLLQIPEILHAAVLSITDLEYGARPIAFIQSSDSSFDIERMKQALSLELPKFKIPIALKQLDDWPMVGAKTNYAALKQFLYTHSTSRSPQAL
ncbi:MAG: AMP-binding protein [Chlamydiia bacterium]|nr:AMP-binding protein [Chlamydiia bacterium]